MIELLGQFIRSTGGLRFRGKSRLVDYWMRSRPRDVTRIRVLPGGGKITCEFAEPYEAHLWLKQEEVRELSVIQQLLEPGQVFLDCGANLGLWTLVAASCVEPGGRVHAFEPNPRVSDRLEAHVAQSGFSNVQVHTCALNAEDGEVAFRCHPNHNVSRITTTEDSSSTTVPARRLDTVVSEEAVAGCKIDVEGAELEVLRGGEAMLRRCRPWLFVELNTNYSNVTQLGQWDVHRYLSDLGYRAWTVEQVSAARTSGSALEDSWNPRRTYCNLFYAPL